MRVDRRTVTLAVRPLELVTVDSSEKRSGLSVTVLLFFSIFRRCRPRCPIHMRNTRASTPRRPMPQQRNSGVPLSRHRSSVTGRLSPASRGIAETTGTATTARHVTALLFRWVGARRTRPGYVTRRRCSRPRTLSTLRDRRRRVKTVQPVVGRGFALRRGVQCYPIAGARRPFSACYAFVPVFRLIPRPVPRDETNGVSYARVSSARFTVLLALCHPVTTSRGRMTTAGREAGARPSFSSRVCPPSPHHDLDVQYRPKCRLPSVGGSET